MNLVLVLVNYNIPALPLMTYMNYMDRF